MRYLIIVVFLCFYSVALVASSFSFDFLNIYSQSDPQLDKFVNYYDQQLTAVVDNEDAIKQQIEVFKEAYWLYVNNYIYKISNEQKEALFVKAQKTLDQYLKDHQAKGKKQQNNLNAEDAMIAVMNNLFNKIDAHTVWMDPKKAEDFIEALTGNHKGIGILFSYDQKKHMIYVIKVFKDSPAEKAGLRDNDYIIAVDGNPIVKTKSLDSVIESIKGPNGTKVLLTIKRQQKTYKLPVVRGDYYVPSVEYSIKDKDYAYIKINSFNQDTNQDFLQALSATKVNQRQGLIIDVRNNPGGLLTAVVLIADHFLQGKEIVSIKGRIDSKNQVFQSIDLVKVKTDLPVVILTNAMSASASELLAGALALNNRATIIGDNTFGKWSVQSSFTLKNSSIFNVTTQLFYGPKDNNFQGIGIAPDIKVITADSNKAFHESDVDYALKVKHQSPREPKLTIKDSRCQKGDVDDKILSCAVLFLSSKSDLDVFIKNLK